VEPLRCSGESRDALCRERDRHARLRDAEGRSRAKVLARRRLAWRERASGAAGNVKRDFLRGRVAAEHPLSLPRAAWQSLMLACHPTDARTGLARDARGRSAEWLLRDGPRADVAPSMRHSSHCGGGKLVAVNPSERGFPRGGLEI